MKSTFRLTPTHPNVMNITFGEQPFVYLPETIPFGAPTGGKGSMYMLHLLEKVYYFVMIQATPFLRSVNSRKQTEVIWEARIRLVDLGHCFGTIYAFWRFPELLMIPNESSRRDLQSETGPGASGAQKMMKIYEILRGTFWDIVLSRMKYFEGFRSS